MAKQFSEEFWTHEDIIKFLGKSNDKVRVVEDIISLNTQQKALRLAAKLNPASIPDEVALKMADKLWDEETSPKELNKILVTIAFRGNVQSFRILEKYKENPHPKVEEMARFCYHISKIILEGELSEEPLGLISTGLGGKNKKLRFFFVIFPEKNLPFTKSQHTIIDNEWRELCSKYEIETEKQTRANEYVAFTVLCPYRFDFFEIVKELINECNIYGNFLLLKMIITNVKLLKRKEILEALQSIRNDKDEIHQIK